MTYSTHIGQELKISEHMGKTMVKFGDDRHKVLDTNHVKIPIDDTWFLSTIIEVVDVEVPLLLGWD